MNATPAGIRMLGVKTCMTLPLTNRSNKVMQASWPLKNNYIPMKK